MEKLNEVFTAEEKENCFRLQEKSEWKWLRSLINVKATLWLTACIPLDVCNLAVKICKGVEYALSNRGFYAN